MTAGALLGLPLARSVASPARALVATGERSGGSARARSARNALVAGQVGLATCLLIVAGLLTRSFVELVRVPVGFDPRGVVTFSVSAQSATYPETADVRAYHQRVLDEVRALADVVDVGMSSDLPFTTENWNTTFVIDGVASDPAQPLEAEYHVMVPEYFEVLGVPVREGSLPTDGMEVQGEIPVVLNERMAERFWPGGRALGARFALDWNDTIPLRVVAIVADALDDGFAEAAEPAFYVPFGGLPTRSMSYLVRARSGPSGLLPRLAEAVARVDPDIPAADLRLLEGLMAETVARPRAASLIGGVFALIALLVAAAGIYGVLSHTVQARTRELGIRTALGATGPELVAMILGQSTRIVVVGLVAGVLTALIAGGALADLLYGVPAWDPVSVAGAVLVLGGVATLAAWLPARRAVSVHPRDALRAD